MKPLQARVVLGYIYCLLGRHLEAMETMPEEFLSTFSHDEPIYRDLMALPALLISVESRKIKNFLVGAIPHATLSYEYKSKNFGDQHRSTRWTLWLLADLHEQCGNAEEAEAYRSFIEGNANGHPNPPDLRDGYLEFIMEFINAESKELTQVPMNDATADITHPQPSLRRDHRQEYLDDSIQGESSETSCIPHRGTHKIVLPTSPNPNSQFQPETAVLCIGIDLGTTLVRPCQISVKHY